jgi:hypothetical protein
MKNHKQIGIGIFLIAVLLTPFFGFAQETADPEKAPKATVVISQNMVPLAQVGRYVELTKQYWAPAFDKLVDDGKLFSWGFITHAWGDEWNVVVHYVAKDFASFESAWNEGISAFYEDTPEEINDEMINLIEAHKDGIYTAQHYYDGK